jgi:acetoin utilization deacetylase AcuC-like enzyme
MHRCIHVCEQSTLLSYVDTHSRIHIDPASHIYFFFLTINLQSGGEDLHYYSNSLSAARASAGSVIAAVDKVLSGRNRNAFCLVRPPGHMAGMYVCMYGRIWICSMRT